jgi:glycosyltransferase involved in cell wall biosynthesis
MKKSLTIIAGKDPLEETAGGHSSYVRAHARAAMRIGFEPHLFCVGHSSGIVETDYGIVHRFHSPLRHLGKPILGSGIRISSIPIQDAILAHAIEKFQHGRKGPQLIHGFGAWASVGVRAQARLRKDGIDSTVLANAYTILDHEHEGKRLGMGSDRHSRKRLFVEVERLWIRNVVSRYEARAYTGAQLVLVNYESVRRMIEARFGARVKTRKIAYTSETAFLRETDNGNRNGFRPAAIKDLEPREAPLIVSVSRHDPRKGISVLLHALAALRAEDLPFRACLVGRGQLLDRHRQLAEQLRLGHETLIAGFVPDSYEYLQCAEIFVLPSLEEGSGSVSLIEALQAGIPVVASNIDGIPEDVGHGKNALLVEPGNVAALTAGLRQMILDAELRKRLADCSQATFKKDFSPLRFARALGDVYAEFGFTP